MLRFLFPNIQLPDSNVNELQPRHRAVPHPTAPPVLPGTTIQNIANIYFDYNLPVITEPSVLVAEFSTSSNESQGHERLLAPNPVADQLFVRTSPGR
ncbi:MAG: hypothetical protein R2817_08690 [Flavobacteriales bacterium]